MSGGGDTGRKSDLAVFHVTACSENHGATFPWFILQKSRGGVGRVEVPPWFSIAGGVVRNLPAISSDDLPCTLTSLHNIHFPRVSFTDLWTRIRREDWKNPSFTLQFQVNNSSFPSEIGCLLWINRQIKNKKMIWQTQGRNISSWRAPDHLCAQGGVRHNPSTSRAKSPGARHTARDVEAAVRDCIEGITAQCCRQEDVPRWSNSFLAVSGVLLQRTTTIVFEVTGEIGGGLGENE